MVIPLTHVALILRKKNKRKTIMKEPMSEIKALNELFKIVQEKSERQADKIAELEKRLTTNKLETTAIANNYKAKIIRVEKERDEFKAKLIKTNAYVNTKAKALKEQA
jgi:hypothetical protein